MAMQYSPPTLRAMLTHIKQWTGFHGHRLRLRAGNGRWSIYLGCVPVVVFVFAYALTAPKAKPQPKPTYIEQVARSDSFSQRFGEDTPRVIRVRTVPIVRQLAAVEPAIDVSGPLPEPPVRIVADTPVRYRRPPSAAILPQTGRDICARHGQRKVMVGKYRWRCRR